MILDRTRTARCGATLVETALVLPVLFLFIYGMVIGGIGVFRHQVLASLAREAARYAQHIVILHDGRVTAAGTPDMVISSQTIADVFKVKTVVIRDPVAGTPLCIPL